MFYDGSFSSQLLFTTRYKAIYVFRGAMMLQARSSSSALQFEEEDLRGVSMSVVEVWLTPSAQCNSCWTCSF
ncbi:hypothetical protein FHG87_012353 [Trinorchestia longiramus]|nr:hypothetical protein FHG87_012353 [Trinorchestia longiramus]